MITANTKDRAGLGSDSTHFTANASTGGFYDSDFDLVQGFAEVRNYHWALPLHVFGDFIKKYRR
jgi:hypothetical protein